MASKARKGKVEVDEEDDGGLGESAYVLNHRIFDPVSHHQVLILSAS